MLSDWGFVRVLAIALCIRSAQAVVQEELFSILLMRFNQQSVVPVMQVGLWRWFRTSCQGGKRCSRREGDCCLCLRGEEVVFSSGSQGT